MVQALGQVFLIIFAIFTNCAAYFNTQNKRFIQKPQPSFWRNCGGGRATPAKYEGF